MQRFGQLLGTLLRGALGLEDDNLEQSRKRQKVYENRTPPFVAESDEKVNQQYEGLFGAQREPKSPIDDLVYPRAQPLTPPNGMFNGGDMQQNDLMYRYKDDPNYLPQMLPPIPGQEQQPYGKPDVGMQTLEVRYDAAGNATDSRGMLLDGISRGPATGEDPGLQRLFSAPSEEFSFQSQPSFDMTLDGGMPQPVTNPAPTEVEMAMNQGIQQGQPMGNQPVDGMPSPQEMETQLQNPMPQEVPPDNPEDAEAANALLNQPSVQEQPMEEPLPDDATVEQAASAGTQGYWDTVGEQDGYNPNESGRAGPMSDSFGNTAETAETAETTDTPTDKQAEDAKIRRDKGPGWLGTFKDARGDDVTEMSMTVQAEELNGGQETLIPLLVPTLTKKEAEWVIKNAYKDKKPPESIMRKAIAHAQQEIAAGRSPFKEHDSVLKTDAADPTKSEKLDQFQTQIAAATPVKFDGKEYKKVDIGGGRFLYLDSNNKEVTNPNAKKRIDRAYGRVESAKPKPLAPGATAPREVKDIDKELADRKTLLSTEQASLKTLEKEAAANTDENLTQGFQNNIKIARERIARYEGQIKTLEEERGTAQGAADDVSRTERRNRIEEFKDIAETRDLTEEEAKEFGKIRTQHLSVEGNRLSRETETINANITRLRKKGTKMTDAEAAQLADYQTRLAEVQQEQVKLLLDYDPEFFNREGEPLDTKDALKAEIAAVTAGMHPEVKEEGGFWKRLGQGLWQGFTMWAESGGEGGLAGLAGAVGAMGMGSGFSKTFNTEMRKNAKLKELFGKWKQETALEDDESKGIKARRDANADFIDSIKADGIVTPDEAERYRKLIGAPIESYDAREFESYTGADGKRYMRAKKGSPASFVDITAPIDEGARQKDYSFTTADGKVVKLTGLTSKEIANLMQEDMKFQTTREDRLAAVANNQAEKLETRQEAFDGLVAGIDGDIAAAEANIEQINGMITDLQNNEDMDEEDKTKELIALRKQLGELIAKKAGAQARKKGLKRPE